MKKQFYYLFIIALTVLFSCNNSEKNAKGNSDSTGISQDTMIVKSNNAEDLDTSDVSFFENAAYGGITEVESSNKILQESKDSSIRTFAEMMVKDHSAANTSLKSIASAKGYILPTVLPESKLAAIRKMDTFKAEGRDEYYMQLMVLEHQKAIDLFSAGSRSRDTTISRFASSILPKLKEHYQHTLRIDTALKAIKANQGDDPLKISNRKKL